jgi:predicted PurR-regulated permease PerM
MSEGFSSDRRGQVEATAPRVSADAAVLAAIVVAGLYLGREVFVPAVLAVLLSFVLAGPVRWLRRWGLGRVISVSIVVVLAFAVILGIGGVLTSQLTRLAGDLPRYQWTIRDKITALRGAAEGRGPLDRAAEVVQDLSNELSGANKPKVPARAGQTTAEGGAVAPIPVEVRPTPAGPVETAIGYVAPLLHPLATFGLVAVFVVFILIQRDDLRNRLIRLAGSHDLQRTTAAMNDAAARLSRLFLTQVLMNAGFGVVVGIGLWIIGIPSPVLWGILAAVSRFIPYVGVVLAAGGPLILSAAVDPGWTMLAATVAFFLVVEFLVGQVVEPLLYGHSTGLSPVAVIASVTFWAWLWGPIGLILATPLTVCLVVLGRHVDRLAFLDVMLGDRPPLTVAENFYQRMLAGDPAEAVEQAEDFLKNHSLGTYYDEVALKGLALAQADANRGALEPDRLSHVEDTIGDLIDELSEHEDAVPEADPKRAAAKRADGDADLDQSLVEADDYARGLPALADETLPPSWTSGAPILCVGGRNLLDRASAAMLAQLLGKHGLPAQVEGPDVLTSGRLFTLDPSHTRVVCLCVLDASSPVAVRYAVRRLRRKLPDAKILVGAWGLEAGEAGGLCEAVRSDACASRLCEALARCIEYAAEARLAELAGPARPERSLQTATAA